MSSRDIISLLESIQSSPASLRESLAEDPDAVLSQCREVIDKLDLAIIQLLNHRVAAASVIADVKKILDLPVYVPSREADVLRNIVDANHGPLDNDAAKRLYERIIDETRANERQRYQDDALDDSDR
ncbi:MAG: chorismate mutase [Rhodothermales bacterium]|nr:chorismate mutase [Rhodothermales bacterium]